MMADKFDPSDPRHDRLRYVIERGNGIACLRTSKKTHDAMIEAEFTVKRAENLGDNNDPII